MLEKEIRAEHREERRLQAAVPALEETRFFLEKVRNERRDVGRRVRAIRAEVSGLGAQLATKDEQLRELQELPPTLTRTRTLTRTLALALTLSVRLTLTLSLSLSLTLTSLAQR